MDANLSLTLKIVFLTLLITLFSWVARGQVEQLKFEDTSIHKTNLLDSTIFKLKDNLILLETDTFAIYTTRKIFYSTLEGMIAKWDIDADRNLLVAVKQDKSSRIDGALNRSGSKYRYKDVVLSDFLQSGKCLIYDKRTKRLIRDISFRQYQRWSGTKSCKYGRVFLTDGCQILKTIDGYIN